MPQRYRGRIIHDRGFQMLTINSKSLKFIQNFENNLKKYKNRFKKAGNWKVGLSLDVSVSDMKFSQEIKSKSSGIFNFTKKNITNIWDMAWKYLRKGKNSRRSVDSANCFRLFSEIQDFSSELTKPVCLSPLVNITICGNLGFLTYFIFVCTLDCSKLLTNGLKKMFFNSNICQPAIYDFFLYLYPYHA